MHFKEGRALHEGQEKGAGFCFYTLIRRVEVQLLSFNKSSSFWRNKFFKFASLNTVSYGRS